jgi:hypothetical protein
MKVEIYVNGKLVECHKKAYNTRKIAWQNALFFREKFGNTSTAYKCRWCRKYHITTHRDGTPPKELVG